MTMTAGLAATVALDAMNGVAVGALPTATSDPWYEVASTIATLIAALGAIGAIVVGIFTIRQRAESDARAQWWSRVQWAVDLTFEEERARRTVGFEALVLLAHSPLARSGDLEFLRGLTLKPLGAVQSRGEGPFALDDAPPTAERVSSQSHRLPVGPDEVAAARLRAATDTAQQAATPAWIDELARTPTA